ncbi:hypothetical protein MTO96_040753 [Rhipicephalus appendiculatus]
MRMIGKEAAECDIDKDPPVSIAEAIARNQLSADEKRKAGAWKKKTPKRRRALASEVHDFVWKKNWDVLPTRERLLRSRALRSMPQLPCYKNPPSMRCMSAPPPNPSGG